MSARRKRVISTEEIQFNHKPAKMLLTKKRRKLAKNGQTPSTIGICSYCVLDRPVFERCQTLLHQELTPWWSFLMADGAHHKKPHSPTHPTVRHQPLPEPMLTYCQLDPCEYTSMKFLSNIQKIHERKPISKWHCKMMAILFRHHRDLKKIGVESMDPSKSQQQSCVHFG